MDTKGDRPLTGGDLLRWRQALHWTQAQAAAELGYSTRNYLRLEHRAGKVPRHAARAVRTIAGYYGLDCRFFDTPLRSNLSALGAFSVDPTRR